FRLHEGIYPRAPLAFAHGRGAWRLLPTGWVIDHNLSHLDLPFHQRKAAADTPLPWNAHPNAGRRRIHHPPLLLRFEPGVVRQVRGDAGDVGPVLPGALPGARGERVAVKAAWRSVPELGADRMVHGPSRTQRVECSAYRRILRGGRMPRCTRQKEKGVRG